MSGAGGIVTVAAEGQLPLCEREWERSRAGADIPHCLIGEPAGRNTAAAIAVAAAYCGRRFSPGAIMAVLPADHLVRDERSWNEALAAAGAAAGEGIALLGIAPTRAETGYGYIRKGGKIGDRAHAVDQFAEKPDGEAAERYLASGEHLWNAGVFVGSAASFSGEIRRHLPEMAEIAEEIVGEGEPPPDRLRPAPELYGRLESISFDYGVAEKARGLAVVEIAGSGWSDVGAWAAFAEALVPADGRGNRVSGEAVLDDCDDCFYWGDRPAVLSGMSGVCVVDGGDATLVCASSRAGQVGKISGGLDHAGNASDPPSVPKPWGGYAVISGGAGYKVKRIDVLPGARLSLQSHRRRSEHWTAILGTPTVTIDGRTFELPVDSSCHIPAGAKHRLANEGDSPAAIIEVQVGDYLGEDDIVRHEDDYGRS